MSEGKEINNFGYKHAIACVSAFIFNSKEELLLVREKAWNNLWVVPGGMVRFGESQMETLKRKIKDEIGIEINDAEYLKVIELNKTKERPNFHAVVSEFIVKSGNQDVKLNNDHSGFDWRKPEDWLKEKDLYPAVREVIEYYLNKFLPAKDCENLYKRALADYQNLLKRTAQEKVEFVKYANEDLIQSIIPVYDNLKMSLAHVDETVEKNGWLEGIKHVIRQFKDVLESMGVEEIKTVGEKFDHNTMEAIEGKGEKVVKEARPGYKLNGKVIVAAKVIVG